MNKTIKTVIGICAAISIMLLAVFLFTRNAYIESFSLSEKPGEIGDAINGMTAPVIALISAGLLFWSFQAQIEANKLLQAQWQFDNYQRHFEKLQEKFDSVIYKHNVGQAIVPYKTENISGMINNGNFDKEEIKKAANEIREQIREFRDYLYLIGGKDNHHRDHFFEKVNNYYHSRIKAPLESIYENIKDRSSQPYTGLSVGIEFLKSDLAKIDSYQLAELEKFKARRQRNRKRVDSKYYRFFKPFYNTEKKNIFDLDEY